MGNYNVTGNKIKFTDPMLVNGNLPDEPEEDALDPLAQYREDQMRQLDSQGAAPSGKPDLANPHPESMAALKAANGGKIPQQFMARKSRYVPENFDYNKSYPMEENGPMASGQKYDLHLQERNRPSEQDYNFRGPLSKDMRTDKGFNDHSGAASGDMGPFVGAGADKYDAYLRQKNPAPKKPVFRYDAGSIGNGQGLQNAVAASRPERPDAGTASTAYGDSKVDGDNESDSEIPPPWEQTDYNRIASNVGQENQPGVTPVDPDTKTSDLAVNPGFTPYYESETGKGVKEQGRQRLQEYLQKLAGRGKQHEERLAHDNDAAGAKARNDFGALLMDSASMMGTLGGKRADTTQLAKFPGKLYQMDMAPSRSAMMYENAEDKDFKSLADIGDRQERTDIARGNMENNRERLKKALKERLIRKRPYKMVDEKGNPVFGTIDDEGHIERATVDPGLRPPPSPTRPPRNIPETQGKFGLYGKGANEEMPLLEEQEKTYVPGFAYEFDKIMPDFIGRHATSPQDKLYAQRTTRLIQHLTHAATGAGMNVTEVIDHMKGYTVKPGMDRAQIEDMQRARRKYVQFILDAAGEAAKGVKLAPRPGVAPQSEPEDMKDTPLEGMTREEKEAELERLQNG